MMRTASCSCGQLKVTCTGEPIRISMCHCLACQKRTGSAFGIQARWPADRVTIEGRAQEYLRTGDEGSTATFRFCPTCGATVYYDSDGMPGMIAVPVGAFADPTFPAPRISVYGVRRHPWAIMPALAIEEDLD
ncbi:MAG: GFA family protein [Kofleriaceae bacterium]